MPALCHLRRVHRSIEYHPFMPTSSINNPLGVQPTEPDSLRAAYRQRLQGLSVAVVMGSDSDWDTLQGAVALLKQFGVAHSAMVVSAHRMPDDLFAFAEAATDVGLAAIIAGAGGAAHLPGMLAAKTLVPVLGVPVASKHLQGVDSLHSIVQMPKGVPVATFAIGPAGAANAALFAVAMLATTQPALAQQLAQFRAQQTAVARAMVLPPNPHNHG